MKRFLSLIVAVPALVTLARGADFSRFKTADDLWGRVEQLANNASPNDQAKFRGQLTDLRAAAFEFGNRYKTDPRRWEALLLQLRVDSTLTRLDGFLPNLTAIQEGVNQIVAAPDASAGTKAKARFFALGAMMDVLDSPAGPTDGQFVAKVGAEVDAVRKSYPDDLRTAAVLFDWADFLKARDLDTAEAILHDLAKHKDPQVAADARSQLDAIQTRRKLAKEPLDLKFTAVDGTEVDLAKLRGKVVLVDFWATWCGPCRMEVPNVVATYNQLQKQGFEVVGISLDRDKQQLIDFTKKSGMKWPQYFDGKVWDNELGKRFGIQAIPAAWLVDKKGFVRSLEARGSNLGDQVKKLLAE
ncbi:MAG TPA: TlpA disulfide reductase family protein [Verrucomicrobiae bacterium]|nr:TlpA disulfide reductase family protein [Verrucomicrobiae bacterium]